jgi:imidazolonepropionase-like amidohydrolase
MRSVRLLLIFALVLAIGLAVWTYIFAIRPLRNPHPAPMSARDVLAITGARIYVSPDAAPMAHGTVLLRDGKIAAVGQQVEVPPGAEVLECDGCVLTAGFWNTHVHFTERKWSGAQWKPGAALQAQLQDMLTSRGFTTVVDTGSNLFDTSPLRRRIEQGEIEGPRIYTAGSAQYPPHGVPYYLRDNMPRWQLAFLAQPNRPATAARVEERNISRGADLLKLFTGSYVARGKVLPMPLEDARAAVKVAHAHGQLAFAHESDLQGVRVAMESGVDVLAHAMDTTEGVDDAVLGSVIAKHMAMIPTLKMFATTVTTDPKYLDPIYTQVRRFHELGGDLLFGTDVGYMTDYDTTDEFRALEHSGLSGRDILRMLTTAPAQRFGVDGATGSIQVGKAGDLVLLDGDPVKDVTAFAAVRATVRGGRVIWRRP